MRSPSREQRVRYDFDDAGAVRDPAEIVDLDTAGAADLNALRAHPPAILIGVATRPPSAFTNEFTRRATVTLVPEGLEQPHQGFVGVTDPVTVAGELRAACAARPRAAVVLDGVLRTVERLPVEQGLIVESLAYSTLQAGPEYGRWVAGHQPREPRRAPEPVTVSREHDELRIVLSDPGRRNAFSRGLRSALIEALSIADADAGIRSVRLSGAGPCFSSGGDLDEFGTAPDPASAHIIRLDQSAGLAVHRVAERTTAVLHGTCIGAGIEVPAFAGTVIARPGTTFRLPEFTFGLIPGAGGTVSISRRIGRWRTAFLALSNTAIDTATARRWGLIDAVEH